MAKPINIAPGVEDRNEILQNLHEYLDENNISAMIVTLKLRDGSVVIMTDDLTMSDYHMLVGYQQTDATLRQLAIEVLQTEEEEGEE